MPFFLIGVPFTFVRSDKVDFLYNSWKLFYHIRNFIVIIKPCSITRLVTSILKYNNKIFNNFLYDYMAKECLIVKLKTNKPESLQTTNVKYFFALIAGDNKVAQPYLMVAIDTL